MFFSDYKRHNTTKVRTSLFWEYDMEQFDWFKLRNIVVQRVLERGRLNDFYAILNLYGEEGVNQAFREISYMNAKDMNFVCSFFGLKKEELKCYTKKQLQTQHWNS